MARIYRNALLSAIVKRLTPEGQPQLLDRGAALSSLVVRCGDVEVEVCDPVLSIPSGCVSMADRALHARAPLAGFALPGRFGAASGKPGLVIEERTGLALATCHRAAGKRAGA
jgi:hypothetical protein